MASLTPPRVTSLCDDSGAITHCVWEGSHVIGEYNGSTGAQLAWYYYAGSRMITKIESGATRYFLRDRLSTRVVLDGSANVVGRQAHLPFGDDFAESGTQEKHHFTSYERDSELGSDYAVNRQYSQSVGRFLRVDPVRGSISNPQGLNRYAYVRNDPINRIDPRGLYDCVVRADGCLVCWGPDWEEVFCDRSGDLPSSFGETEPAVIEGPRPNHDPEVEPVPPKTNQEIIADGVADAKTVLSGNNDCSRFFGGSQGALDVLNAFAKLMNPGPIQDRTVGIRQTGQQTISVNAQTGFTYRLFASVTVNNLGGFFLTWNTSTSPIKPLPPFGGYASGSKQARVVMILHELAHMIQDPKTKQWLIPTDGGDEDKSKENTKTIMKACRKEIDKLK